MSEHTKGPYETVSQIMTARAALKAELNAARALLREVSDFGLYIQPNGRMEFKGEQLTSRLYDYLDACDTLEGK